MKAFYFLLIGILFIITLIGLDAIWFNTLSSSLLEQIFWTVTWLAIGIGLLFLLARSFSEEADSKKTPIFKYIFYTIFSLTIILSVLKTVNYIWDYIILGKESFLVSEVWGTFILLSCVSFVAYRLHQTFFAEDNLKKDNYLN
jgi:hypothetical protein